MCQVSSLFNRKRQRFLQDLHSLVAHIPYSRAKRGLHELKNRGYFSWVKKLEPCKIFPPKFSAMVCPISASVARVPKFTPAPQPGEYATIGTYSREWSVVSQRGSGSHPWSAVIISKSARVSRRRKSASSASNSSSDFANPSTSLRCPYNMSKSTRLQKITPSGRSRSAALNFSMPSTFDFVVT